MTNHSTTYRDFVINYNPKPIPPSCGVDWDWYHKDIDLDDNRYGYEKSYDDCIAAIDFWYLENEDES